MSEETFSTARTFDATPSELWEAITDPASLANWMGDNVEGTVEFSPTNGAEGTLDLAPAEGGTRVLIVEEIEPERHLRFRWASTDEAPTEVSFDIEPTDEGTRLYVTERTIPPGLAVAIGRPTTMHRTATHLIAA